MEIHASPDIVLSCRITGHGATLRSHPHICHGVVARKECEDDDLLVPLNAEAGPGVLDGAGWAALAMPVSACAKWPHVWAAIWNPMPLELQSW